jgi:multisubunit Na+/H+ antiporter MnhB subunit
MSLLKSIIGIIVVAAVGIILIINDNPKKSNNKTAQNSHSLLFWLGLGFIGAAVLWVALFILYYGFRAR